MGNGHAILSLPGSLVADVEDPGDWPELRQQSKDRLNLLLDALAFHTARDPAARQQQEAYLSGAVLIPELQIIWDALTPALDVSMPVAPSHALWKTLGFQGNDPLTDLRAAGLLPLKCLAYLVSSPRPFCRMTTNRLRDAIIRMASRGNGQGDVKFYTPILTAAVQLSSRLAGRWEFSLPHHRRNFRACRWVITNSCRRTRIATPEVLDQTCLGALSQEYFYHIFTIAFRVLIELLLKERRQYMDFGYLIDAVLDTMQLAIDRVNAHELELIIRSGRPNGTLTADEIPAVFSTFVYPRNCQNEQQASRTARERCHRVLEVDWNAMVVHAEGQFKERKAEHARGGSRRRTRPARNSTASTTTAVSEIDLDTVTMQLHLPLGLKLSREKLEIISVDPDSQFEDSPYLGPGHRIVKVGAHFVRSLTEVKERLEELRNMGQPMVMISLQRPTEQERGTETSQLQSQRKSTWQVSKLLHGLRHFDHSNLPSWRQRENSSLPPSPAVLRRQLSGDNSSLPPSATVLRRQLSDEGKTLVALALDGDTFIPTLTNQSRKGGTVLSPGAADNMGLQGDTASSFLLRPMRPKKLDYICENGTLVDLEVLIQDLRQSAGPNESKYDVVRRKFTTKDKFGWPPVCIAARCGQAEVLERLLNCGADPHASDGSGWTALEWASNYDHADCLRVLFDAFADADSRPPTHRGIGRVSAFRAFKIFRSACNLFYGSRRYKWRLPKGTLASYERSASTSTSAQRRLKVGCI